MRQLIGPILFLLSSGILFNERVKGNRIVVCLTGAVAVVATVFTIHEAVGGILAWFNGAPNSAVSLAEAVLVVGASILFAVIGAVLGTFIKVKGSRKVRMPEPSLPSGPLGGWSDWIGEKLEKVNASLTVTSYEDGGPTDHEIGLRVWGFAILGAVTGSFLAAADSDASFVAAIFGFFAGAFVGCAIMFMIRWTVRILIVVAVISAFVGVGRLLHHAWTALS